MDYEVAKLVASLKSYDLTIKVGDAPPQPFVYGAKGGLSLGHALLEPSAPSRVDTVPIQSLHHGYGRVVATDSMMARDSNGKDAFADTRAPGFIMPAGALTLLDSFAITNANEIEQVNGYAAVSALDNGDVVFGAGKQLFKIDAETEAITETSPGFSDIFSGSSVVWNNDLWMGVMSAFDYATIGAYNYDTASLNVTNTYMFSWAGSTRNSIFWIRNRNGAAPQLRWSDRTDQDFGNFNANFIYPNATNAYVLEIPKALVTGAGIAGQFFLYASKGGNIWGLDRNEVFTQLTPDPVAVSDNLFGGQMKYIGSWLLVPNVDGIGRFDPRNISLTDISPPVHQGATPGIGELDEKRVHFATPTPTGALVAVNLIGDDINIQQLEMFEDGMFWHPTLQSLGDVSHVWGMIVVRYKVSGQFTSQLKALIIASNGDYDEWNIYKLDLATAQYAPGPATLASSTGFRTGYYTSRPPDVTASPTQVRGFANASDANPINLYLSVDNDEATTPLGIITKTGPFVLPVGTDVLPGRKFAVSGTLNVTDQSGELPFLTLPLSIDYRYVNSRVGKNSDFFTLKFEARSDQIGNITSRLFTHGRTIAQGLVELDGTQVVIAFADTKTEWVAIVENSDAALMEQADARQAPSYLITMACRRIA